MVVDSPPGITKPVDGRQLGRTAHRDGSGAALGEHRQVLAHVALQGEHADGGGHEAGVY